MGFFDSWKCPNIKCSNYKSGKAGENCPECDEPLVLMNSGECGTIINAKKDYQNNPEKALEKYAERIKNNKINQIERSELEKQKVKEKAKMEEQKRVEKVEREEKNRIENEQKNKDKAKSKEQKRVEKVEREEKNRIENEQKNKDKAKSKEQKRAEKEQQRKEKMLFHDDVSDKSIRNKIYADMDNLKRQESGTGWMRMGTALSLNPTQQMVGSGFKVLIDQNKLIIRQNELIYRELKKLNAKENEQPLESKSSIK